MFQWKNIIDDMVIRHLMKRRGTLTSSAQQTAIFFPTPVWYWPTILTPWKFAERKSLPKKFHWLKLTGDEIIQMSNLLHLYPTIQEFADLLQRISPSERQD